MTSKHKRNAMQVKQQNDHISVKFQELNAERALISGTLVLASRSISVLKPQHTQ